MHKNRFFILGMMMTLIIVLLCLLIPGILLDVKTKSGVGRVLQGDKLYSADDVAGETQDFNFQKRLMMLSGQWKCSKEKVDKTDGVISEYDIRIISSIILDTFRNKLFDDVNGKLIPYFMNESEIPLDHYGGSEYQAIKETQAMEYNVNETEWSASRLEGLSPTVIMGGTADLYQYTDKVFNTYSFYVWEFQISDENTGMVLECIIDAVTLDIYSFSLTGNQVSDLPWEESIVKFYDGNRYDSFMDNLSSYTSMSMDISYFCMATYPFELAAGIYDLYMDVYVDQIDQLGNQENGYNFNHGNFIHRQAQKCEVASAFAFKLTSNEENVYFCLDILGDGMKFYFTLDAEDGGSLFDL